MNEEWLRKQLKSLGTRKFHGSLRDEDQALRDTKLAAAGRELNRGRITEAVYQEYVSNLLGNKENAARFVQERERRKQGANRPRSAPPKRTVPQAAWGTAGRKPPPREPLHIDVAYEARVHKRAEKERSRALAWMNRKVAEESERRKGVRRGSEEELVLTSARSEGGSSSARGAASQRVVVSGAPSGTTKEAIAEAMRSAFGSVATVDSIGGRSFVVRFMKEQAAAAALRDERCTLKNSVVVEPLPDDAGAEELRRMLSRWGRVVTAKATPRDRAAIVVFESEASATAALGQHRLEAMAELRVKRLPPEATLEHVRRAYGGKRQGVVDVKFDGIDGTAIVVFETPELARRNAGTRTMTITTEGGTVNALGKARLAARKGRDAPWHSAVVNKPFADFELHSHNFGAAPSSAREFKKRAAGIYATGAGPRPASGEGTSTGRYSTRRVNIVAETSSMTITVKPYDLILDIRPF